MSSAQALLWWHFSPGVGEGTCSPWVLVVDGPRGEGELCLICLWVLLRDFLPGPGYVGSYWLLLWMPLP